MAQAFGRGGDLDRVMPAGLRALRGELDASGCSVWLAEPGGMRQAWKVGRDGFTESEATRAAAALVPSAPDLQVVRLRAGRGILGLLVVRLRTPGDAEASATLEAVAGFLVPILVQSMRLRELEATVVAGTREIEAQRAFFERIVDTLPVGLYVIDREFRVRAWNRKRETGLQGVARTEVLGHPIFEVLHRQPADVLRREFDALFADGRIQQFQTESTATGEPRVYRLSKIPMRTDGGDITHAITIGEDITDWKKAEARVAQAEKLAALGTLAAGVMHEINNPLATIAAAAESLEMRMDESGGEGEALPAEALVPEVRSALRLIGQEVTRCSGIVAGVLDFSRPRSAHRQPVSLNAVVERTLFLLSHHARFKKLRVFRTLATELPPVVANDEQLIQVLMALLLNAMDAVESRGTNGSIHVRTAAGDEGQVVVAVEDEGVGIRSEELPRIFEPFYTTKPVGRGTGLGLSVCYSIVSDHGGRIDVSSVHGRGSVFRVFLPTAKIR